MNKEQRPFVPKTPMDFQKLKLERLMQNPDKPVIIPETPKEKKGIQVPEFVRNVMGSSAGAGSGEFHVYRHLRRKEYTRQKMIDEKGKRERLDDEYHEKLEENKRKMEEKTAKNRAKRLKRKQKLNMKRKLSKGSSKNISASKGSTTEEEDSDEEKSSGNTDDEQEKETQYDDELKDKMKAEGEQEKETQADDQEEETKANEQIKETKDKQEIEQVIEILDDESTNSSEDCKIVT